MCVHDVPCALDTASATTENPGFFDAKSWPFRQKILACSTQTILCFMAFFWWSLCFASHFRERHEVLDDDSEAYCWRRSGFFWRMRASLGLACAQATTLASQAKAIRGPEPGAQVLEPLHLTRILGPPPDL